ncbi:hypothetical protein [Thermaurantiacus sp.]
MMDVRLRLIPYANGSMGLEMQDFEGTPFYWPTLPFSPAWLADVLPNEEVPEHVVAIKPSALRSGMVDALIAAGLLTDLGLEVAAERTYARLMRVEFRAAQKLAAAAMRDAPEVEPYRLRPLTVPPAWKPACQRIRQALRRRGIDVCEADAMLAWALESGAVGKMPRPLPATAEQVATALAPWFVKQEGMPPRLFGGPAP